MTLMVLISTTMMMTEWRTKISEEEGGREREKKKRGMGGGVWVVGCRTSYNW